MCKPIVCRLCLFKNEFMFNIFDENGEHAYKAADVIEDLLRIKVKREDGRPHQVCVECLDKLTHFKVFKTKCYDSHIAFGKEYSDDFHFSEQHYRSTSVSGKQYDEDPPETVTADYIPSQLVVGLAEIKAEKEEEEEDSQPYDRVQEAEEVLADIEIKTECIEEDEAYGENADPSQYSVEHPGKELDDDYGGLSNPTTEENIKVHEIWIPEMNSLPSTQTAPQSLVFHGEDGQLDLGEVNHGDNNPTAGPSKEMLDEYPCPQCGKRFIHLSYLNKHLRRIHNAGIVSQKNHECKICNMRFAKRGNLERHSMVHTGVRSYPCSRCDKSFFHRSDLQGHMNSHSSRPFVRKFIPFVCSYCQKGFVDKLKLIEHVYHHTGCKPFICPRCNRQFGTLKHLKLHEEIHGQTPTYRCDECDKTFKNRVYFLSHQRRHKGEVYGCLECGKTFVHKHSLKLHEELHKEDGGFCCEYCGKKFDKKPHLRVHLMIHTGERPYGCKYCPKRFMAPSHLRVHLKLHTGERSFYCNFCGKGFVQKSHYVDHVRIHTGERPFVCTECSRAFSQKTQLRQHMKTHSKTR